MSNIKGLLLKDFLLLRFYKKSFFTSIIIFLLIVLLNFDDKGTMFFGIFMIMFLFSVFSLSTFRYDEVSKSDRYILVLPLSKKEVVLSKYIFVFLCLFLGALFGLIISFLLFSLGLSSSFDVSNILISLLVFFTLCSFIQSIQIPCMYKYGAEKGRIQIYVIMAFIALLGTILYMLFPNLDFSFIDAIDKYLPCILFLLIFVNYFVSYKISCKIYLKKEV